MARSTKAGLPRPPALPLLRLLAVSAVALTTANCAQNAQKLAATSGSSYDAKYGVKASPRLYKEGDVIPKGGGRRFSGKPYVVAGRTYVPREDAKGYVREGLASWYGSAFHGRMTANGEVFDRHSIAAAHPTLPLPSYARVTNLANGHSMVVRVNDRGPYHANRVMDVSEEVAQALEFHRSGTARVRVEYVGKASTAGSDDRKLLATLRTDGEPAALRGRSPVMMADLGPDAEPASRPTRSALAFKPAPETETAEAETETKTEAPAPAPRPVRAAPILLASAATVAVPAALQPTAARPAPFRPTPVATPAAPVAHFAQLPTPARKGSAPLSLAPPPMRLASAGLTAPMERPASTRAATGHGGPAPRVVAGLNLAAEPARAGRGQAASRAAPGQTRIAAAPAPIPPGGRLALAKLAQMPAAPHGKTAAPVLMAGAKPVPGRPATARVTAQAASVTKAAATSKSAAMKPAPARRSQVAEVY